MALLLRALSAPEDRIATAEPGVALRRAAWLPALSGRLAGMRGPAAAVTLGRTIVFHPAAPVSERLLRHELEHVRQWRSEGLAFPVRYVAEHLRHGYRDNAYEVAARRAEAEAESSGGRAPRQEERA